MPTLSCVVTVQCPSAAAMAMTSELGEEFQDSFGGLPMTAVAESLGIPSEINIIAPHIPDVRVLHDIPVVIQVEAPKIPNIQVEMKEPIPTEIKLTHDIPQAIEVVAVDIPSRIVLDSANVPTVISIAMPKELPTVITLDASGIPDVIQVAGVPSVIELIGSVPSIIQLVMPEKPEVELVYKGAPIDVKIQLDVSKLTGEDGEEGPACVAIVPCPKK